MTGLSVWTVATDPFVMRITKTVKEALTRLLAAPPCPPAVTTPCALMGMASSPRAPATGAPVSALPVLAWNFAALKDMFGIRIMVIVLILMMYLDVLHN